jgi:hypothetical protein
MLLTTRYPAQKLGVGNHGARMQFPNARNAQPGRCDSTDTFSICSIAIVAHIELARGKLVLMPALRFLFVTVFGFWGMYESWLGYLAIRGANSSRNWPFVYGKVKSAQIAERQQPGEPGVRPSIVYEYIVDERSFTGTLVAFGMQPNYFSGNSFARRYIDRYPAGSTALVYYDPLLPDQCVLESGWTVWTLAPMLWAMLMLGGCAGALLFVH